jgi:hypothetical protein
MKKLIKYLLSFSCMVMLVACMKDAEDEIIGCDPPESNGAFRVMDKTSGADLFIGSNPRYKRADVKIYPFNYKNDKDTLTLSMFSSATQSAFIFSLKTSRDTILVKIADTPMDTLIYTVKKSSHHCLPNTIDKAYFNSAEMIQENHVLVFKK